MMRVKIMSKIQNNSEILFIYEAKLTNPNGDPDDENRPRMDPKMRRNLVSDVRLKRYFRDYMISQKGEDNIWVTKLDGRNVDATERLKKIGGPEDVLKKCIDARLFGATIPEKGTESKSKGRSTSYTGPVQFTWGYSLHKVDLVDSRTITSILSGRDTGYGNIGKDYRVYYSLIAFYGAVSAKRAEITGASEEDLSELDESLWKSLITESVTRSKIGQRPLLYLRMEYSSPESMKGDLRRFISVKEKKDNIREFFDLELKMDNLLKLIEQTEVVKVIAKCSDEFRGFCDGVAKICNDKNKTCKVDIK